MSNICRKVMYVGSGKGLELHHPLKDGQTSFMRGIAYDIVNSVDFERLMRSNDFVFVNKAEFETAVETPVVAEEVFASDAAVDEKPKKKGDKVN